MKNNHIIVSDILGVKLFFFTNMKNKTLYAYVINGIGDILRGKYMVVIFNVYDCVYLYYIITYYVKTIYSIHNSFFALHCRNGTEPHWQYCLQGNTGGACDAAGARVPALWQHCLLPGRDNVVQGIYHVRHQRPSKHA